MFLLLLYELFKNKSLATLFIINKWLLLYFFTNLIMFLNYTPTLRFFGGILISIIATYSFYLKQNIYIKKDLKNIILIPLMLFSIILIPRIYQYQTSELNSINDYALTVPKISYKELNNYSLVIPSKGEQCWINLKCIPYEDDIKIKVTNLNYFIYLK